MVRTDKWIVLWFVVSHWSWSRSWSWSSSSSQSRVLFVGVLSTACCSIELVINVNVLISHYVRSSWGLQTLVSRLNADQVNRGYHVLSNFFYIIVVLIMRFITWTRWVSLKFFHGQDRHELAPLTYIMWLFP